MWITIKTSTIIMEYTKSVQWIILIMFIHLLVATATPTLRPTSRSDISVVDDDIWGDSSSLLRTTRAHSSSRSDTDVLSRLEDKLRSMDVMNAAAKTARSDFVLEQVSRRLDSIESKLSRLEIKFDVRLEKVEEVVMGKEIKEEFASDQLSRQIENLGDKVANKLGFLEAKMGLRIDNLSSRLDRSERQLQGSLDDVLDKLEKTDDKQMQSEARMWSRIGKMEDATSAHDLRTYVREELGGFMSKRLQEIGHKIDKGFEDAKDTSERRHDAVKELNEAVAGVRTTIDDILRRIDEGSINRTCDQRARAKASDSTIAATTDDDFDSYSTHSEGAHPKMELFTLQTSAKLSNLTSSVAEAVQLGEKKFKELDRDVEVYTRKVLTELQKGNTKMELHLSSALNQVNQTRLAMQEGFRKLSQQIQPVTTLGPKMDEMTQEFEKRLEELSAIVDERFASLLVSQNTFIASCHRIQAQEPQFEKRIGDMLQEVKEDVQSRLATSASDTRFLRTALNNHNVQIGKALNDLVWTLLSVGNQTKADMRGIAVQVSTMQQLQRNSRHASPPSITTATSSTNGETRCSCLIDQGDWDTLSQACVAMKGKSKGNNPLTKETPESGSQKAAEGQKPHRRHHNRQQKSHITTTSTQKPVIRQKFHFDSDIPMHDQAMPIAIPTSEEVDATMLPPYLEDLQLAHDLQQSKTADYDLENKNHRDSVLSSPEHHSATKSAHDQHSPRHTEFAQSKTLHHKQLNNNSGKKKSPLEPSDYGDIMGDEITDSPIDKLFKTQRGDLNPSDSETVASVLEEDDDKKSNDYDYEDDYSDDYDS